MTVRLVSTRNPTLTAPQRARVELTRPLGAA
jgi:hypothetical protein